MTITPELIAIGILGVSMVSLGWKVSSDIRQEFKHELKREIHYVREDVAHVREDVGDLRERMARLEGLFEGFTKRELAEQKN